MKIWDIIFDMKKLYLLFLLLVLKALFVAFLIVFSGIGLGPDEAQYWTWSKELSLGYYSKPPGIAWQIWLGTSIFGDTEFGVRFGSLVLGSLLPIAVFALAKSAKLSENTAFWAAIIMAFSPLGFLATFFAITDVGVVLFWTLCLIPLISAIENERTPNYFLIGFLAALGALFKWQIYWIWLLIFPLLCIFPYLKSLRLLAGIGISLIGLLPSLYWNMTHEWATFRHVGATFLGAKETISKGNFFEFLGAQTALISPLLFFALIASFKDFIRAKRSLKVLGGICLAIIVIHSFLAIFKKIQGNWADYAYPAGIVYLAWYCHENVKLRFMQGGICLSIVLTLFAFALPELHQKGLPVNPFRHNMGWSYLNNALIKSGYNANEDFLFSSTYQNTSIISFYNKIKKRAYFFNLFNIRKNQFSFWPQMKERELNNNGYYVLIENGKNAEEKIQSQIEDHIEKLKPFFDKIEIIGFYPLLNCDQKVVKVAGLIKCSKYNGLTLISESRY